MNQAKILYGVCGIGMGHTMRQLMIMEHLAAAHRLVVFAYGTSHKFLGRHFTGNPAVTIEPVSVPFYVGRWDGLDFAETLKRHREFGHDHFALNCAAMARAQQLIGKPDLVISDYEPTAAQYAYSQNSPLVTIDQQSKYLVGKFPAELAGQTHTDEECRLRMFFPKAAARIACSFFAVEKKPRTKDASERVLVAPSIIRQDVCAMRRRRRVQEQTILVYVSSQREFVQDMATVASILSGEPSKQFHVFLPEDLPPPAEHSDNVTFYKHGDPSFSTIVERAAGVITTAGHSLLSELMYLGIPAYVIPLAVYEQQMNAQIVDAHGFGVRASAVEAGALKDFLARLPDYAQAIKNDRTVLLKGSGKRKIISYLTSRFLS